MMDEYPVVPLTGYRERPEDEMVRRARDFRAELKRRRTVRHFSSRPVARTIIDECLGAATTAPSGANLQPWHFVVVGDAETKRRIREAAEEEERRFYHHRAPQEWLDALAPLGTDWRKPHIEVKHYYPMESVGLATGMLIAALHVAGLATLTHTPSPMAFLNEILKRPASVERPFLLLVTGYPAENATVPDIARKPLGEVVSYI